MPRRSSFNIVLSKAERAESLTRSRCYTSRYRDVIRAKIVLLASEGMANDAIAARLDTPRQIVSKWRRRFHLQRLAGLEEHPRGGRWLSQDALRSWRRRCWIFPRNPAFAIKAGHRPLSSALAEKALGTA